MELFGVDIASDALLLAAIVAGVFGVFDHIWELLLDIWDWLIPFEVIMEFEQAVVLRWGKYNRTVGPGFRWKWPFGIEDIIEDTVVRRTAYGDVQSCESKDGVPVNISIVVIYYVGNIKRWTLEVDDAADAVLDISYGVLEEFVVETDWKDIKKAAFKEEVFNEIREEGKNWGARITEIKFSDRSKSKALRLWTGTGHVEMDDDE